MLIFNHLTAQFSYVYPILQEAVTKYKVSIQINDTDIHSPINIRSGFATTCANIGSWINQKYIVLNKSDNCHEIVNNFLADTQTTTWAFFR